MLEQIIAIERQKTEELKELFFLILIKNVHQKHATVGDLSIVFKRF